MEQNRNQRRKKPSYITVTLNARTKNQHNEPVETVNPGLDQNTSSSKSSSTNSNNSKENNLRLQWEQTCAKWGFVIERNVTYVKPLEKSLDLTPTSSLTEKPDDAMIQSQQCEKLKDELVISKIIEDNDNEMNGSEDLMEGDIIHSVYGMQDPTLSLLFGIMRDSNSFQMTVKRMESDIERRYRVGELNESITTFTSKDSPTVSNQEEKPLQNYEEVLSCPNRSSEEVTDTNESSDASLQKIPSQSHSKTKSNETSTSASKKSDDILSTSGLASKENSVSSQTVNMTTEKSFKPAMYKNPYLKTQNSAAKSLEDKTMVRNETVNKVYLQKDNSNINDEQIPNGQQSSVMHNNNETDNTDINQEQDDVAIQSNGSRNKNENDNPTLDEKSGITDEHQTGCKETPFIEDDRILHIDEMTQEQESISHQCRKEVNSSLHIDAEHQLGGQVSHDIEHGHQLCNKDMIQEKKVLKNSNNIENMVLSDELLQKEENLLQKIIDDSISDAVTNQKSNNDCFDSKENEQERGMTKDHLIDRKKSSSSISSELSKKSKGSKRRKLNSNLSNEAKTLEPLPNMRKPSISFDVSDKDDEEKEPRQDIHRPRINSESSLSQSSSLTLPRASPVTISRQNITTKASSKSSKVGLSTVKATKLKRLWPNSITIVKRILKWTPPTICKVNGKIRFRGSAKSSSTDFPILPTTFKDTSELLKTMTPHILEEGVRSVEQEFLSNSDSNSVWNREVFPMKLRSCIPVEPKSTSAAQVVRTYELSFSLEGFNSSPPPSNLGEIFVVHCPSWTQATCLGIIGSNDINTTFLADQKLGNDENDLFKLWICVCSSLSEKAPGWLQECNLPSKEADGSVKMELMYVTNIGTSTDMMRQYEGLKSLACVKPHLKRTAYGLLEGGEAIASREIISDVPLNHVSKPRSVVGKVWDHLTENSNKYQLFAIENIMSGKLKDGTFLLQGPPGTGKTQVITQLVSALLNGSSTKASGTRVQVGGALHGDENPILNASVARRILVVAPSNQAVDELAWRIHKHSIGPNGKIGGFNIIRFGMLPGEERHDGRGRKANQRTSSFHSNDRDKFLSDINLDNLVRDIACGREVNDFAYRKDEALEEASSRNQNGQRKSRFINYSIERQKILDQCHIICSTISGAGSKAFIEAASRDAYAHSEFDAVIIDEACQASDYSTLIPFKYNPNIVVLVGDPNQLPIMTLSKTKNCNADRSLFERLQQCGWPLHMLRIQYRMHPEIVKFPSRTFYSGNLITSDHILKGQPSPWHSHCAFPPYLMWNFYGSIMHRSPLGGISNRGEASFVVELLQTFANQNTHIRNLNIGIISFYNEQVLEIKNKVKNSHLDRWMYSNKISLQISTVDGFQGSEKDIIILSCVRSRWINDKKPRDVGFLKDFRRVNVALTRAKYSLWIVADCRTLSKDPLWSSLIDDAYDRGLIAQYQNLENMITNPRVSGKRHIKKRSHRTKM